MFHYYRHPLQHIAGALLALSLVLGLALPIGSASGSIAGGSAIFVTTTQDELNQNGNCSLREAVRSANLDMAVDGCNPGTGMDTILLDAGLHRLGIPGAGEDGSLTGDLDLLDDVVIIGKNATETLVDGNHLDRVFHIASNITVKLINLHIQNGSAPGGGGESYGGGGILNQNGVLEIENSVISGNQAAHTGGGIDNASTTLLNHVTFSGNMAEDGGGIFNDGTLNLNRVTMTGNTATNTGGGLDNSSEATLIDVTLSGNTGQTQGGGLFNDGNVTLLNTTVTGNNTGVANANVARFKNTIVANSTDKNCLGSGTFTSSGNNLDSAGTCHFTQPTDLSSVDPSLGPLQDNGGEILTHALLPGSSAIDKGNNLDCPALDERGARRPADGDGDDTALCDIGAYELEGIFPVAVFLPTISR